MFSFSRHTHRRATSQTPEYPVQPAFQPWSSRELFRKYVPFFSTPPSRRISPSFLQFHRCGAGTRTVHSFSSPGCPERLLFNSAASLHSGTALFAAFHEKSLTLAFLACHSRPLLPGFFSDTVSPLTLQPGAGASCLLPHPLHATHPPASWASATCCFFMSSPG